MSNERHIILFSLLCISVLVLSHTVWAFPASSFNQQYGDWYDNFGIDRNYSAGPNGYLPNLATETLNENRELAFSIGEQFQLQFPDKVGRAAAILKYVQTWTEYGYDSDVVVKGGVPQDEWAWNADEMAHAFDETTGVKAIGDCEDMAFLCGTIYLGAGFDAAVIDATNHAALLIWLPEFSNANAYWDLPNDNRDAGWIWVEATGSSNPLGWTPPDFEGGGWTAYPIGSLSFVAEPVPIDSTSTSSGGLPSLNSDILIAVIGIVFSLVLALLKARSR
jgi:hypothetical protein